MIAFAKSTEKKYILVYEVLNYTCIVSIILDFYIIVKNFFCHNLVFKSWKIRDKVVLKKIKRERVADESCFGY